MAKKQSNILTVILCCKKIYRPILKIPSYTYAHCIDSYVTEDKFSAKYTLTSNYFSEI